MRLRVDKKCVAQAIGRRLPHVPLAMGMHERRKHDRGTTTLLGASAITARAAVGTVRLSSANKAGLPVAYSCQPR